MAEHIFKTPTDVWCTSEVVWGPLVRAFGAIGLDPCSNAQSGVPACVRVFYDVPTWAQPALEQRFAAQGVRVLFASGLDVCWTGYGLVYINPPFSKIGPWVDKIAAGEGDDVVLLIPSRTGAGFFQDGILPTVSATCWLRRGGPGSRIYEVAKGIPPPAHPPWHSVLHYWGDKVEKFRYAVEGLGHFEAD